MVLVKRYSKEQEGFKIIEDYTVKIDELKIFYFGSL